MLLSNNCPAIAYTLDPNGRRTSREENGDLAIFGYDPVGQLTSVASSANATYTYDPVGNRQNVTGAVPGAGGYLADALNRYTAAPGGGAAYDPRGNLVAQAGRTLGYDSRNRLVSATVGGNTVTTTYDFRNRAVKRTVNGTATFFVWDDWSLIAELDASGTVLKRAKSSPTSKARSSTPRAKPPSQNPAAKKPPPKKSPARCSCCSPATSQTTPFMPGAGS